MCKSDNLTTFTRRLSGNLGASTSWKSQGLSRPVMGLLAFFLFHPLKIILSLIWNYFSSALFCFPTEVSLRISTNLSLQFPQHKLLKYTSNVCQYTYFSILQTLILLLFGNRIIKKLVENIFPWISIHLFARRWFLKQVAHIVQDGKLTVGNELRRIWNWTTLCEGVDTISSLNG